MAPYKFRKSRVRIERYYYISLFRRFEISPWFIKLHGHSTDADNFRLCLRCIVYRVEGTGFVLCVGTKRLNIVYICIYVLVWHIYNIIHVRLLITFQFVQLGGFLRLYITTLLNLSRSKRISYNKKKGINSVIYTQKDIYLHYSLNGKWSHFFLWTAFIIISGSWKVLFKIVGKYWTIKKITILIGNGVWNQIKWTFFYINDILDSVHNKIFHFHIYFPIPKLKFQV